MSVQEKFGRAEHGLFAEKARNQAGFTIIEVLVSLAIILLALLSLSSLQTASISSNATSQQMTIATALAQDKIEELKSLAYTDPQLDDTQNNFIDTDSDGRADYFDWSMTVDHTNADGPGGVANPIDASGSNVASHGYTRVWNVSDNTPAANMKLVSVRVTYSFKGPRSVTLDSIISR